MRDLIKNPVWQKSELGFPLPDSKHAVSVALPTWNDVIDYEEKNPKWSFPPPNSINEFILEIVCRQ